MEYTRSWEIKITHDTNKETTVETYDNVESAARSLVEKLTDDERHRLFHQYCIHCGSGDITCQCWDDE